MELLNEQVYKKIEEIYNTEKGKGFITHLIRSFFPVNRSNYMISRNEKKAMFCSLTRKPLMTKDDVLKLQLGNSEQVFKSFSVSINEDDNEKPLDGKVLAVECENSTKLLSIVAYKQLYMFITDEIGKGNKHIGFVINDERKKEINKNKPTKEVEKKVIHRATTKLGDMDALSKLKQKLEQEGK